VAVELFCGKNGYILIMTMLVNLKYLANY